VLPDAAFEPTPALTPPLFFEPAPDPSPTLTPPEFAAAPPPTPTLTPPGEPGPDVLGALGCEGALGAEIDPTVSPVTGAGQPCASILFSCAADNDLTGKSQTPALARSAKVMPAAVKNRVQIVRTCRLLRLCTVYLHWCDHVPGGNIAVHEMVAVLRRVKVPIVNRGLPTESHMRFGTLVSLASQRK